MKTQESNGKPDRVTISIGRRISITKFDGCEVFVRYDQDVVGQTPEKAIVETRNRVIKEFERLVAMVEHGNINVGPKQGEQLR